MGEHLAQGVSQSAQGGIKENELNGAKGAQHIYQSQNSTEKHLDKQELLKFLDEPQPKPSRSEPNEPKKLGAILADNGTDLTEIDGEQELFK